MPLSDGNLHERYRRYTVLKMHHFIYYAKLSAGSLLACLRAVVAAAPRRKGTYSTAKKFSELDGARNCVAGNDHVSRSDNPGNNCAVSRITEALHARRRALNR